MSDAVALDSARTGTPDGTNGIKIPTILMTEDNTLEAPCGISLTDAIPNGASAHRSNLTSIDSNTDMSSVDFGDNTPTPTPEQVKNHGALVVWVAFYAASMSCTLRPIWYDSAATPAPQALGPALSFSASAKRLSASGYYMSEAQVIDTMGFKRFKMFLESVSAASGVDIYAVPI